jgi:2-polyprenyl-3-methyl-5-hydroxy-6-metoxy-1,4-benzoquinol methylase
MSSLRVCEVCEHQTFENMFFKADHQFVRCTNCGLERIDPPPSDETLSKIYGAHYYEAWGLHGNEQVVAELKKATFRYVLDRVPVRPGAKILDCGAATGFLLDVAKERGLEPYAVELSEFGAKEIARKFGEDRVHCGQLEAAKFPGLNPMQFDAVTMCDYIEHVRDPLDVLKRVRSLLNPHHGVVGITTPNTASLSRKLMGNSWSHYKVEHLYYFSPSNLERMLKRAGFARVSFHPLVKSLSLNYVAHQLDVYPHPVLSPIARSIRSVTPQAVKKLPLKFMAGELLAVAHCSA